MGGEVIFNVNECDITLKGYNEEDYSEENGIGGGGCGGGDCSSGGEIKETFVKIAMICSVSSREFECECV